MANYHILDGRPDGNQLIVVFHLPVPNLNNGAGVNYRTALAEYAPFVESQVPASRLGSDELAALQSGELYEFVWQYDTNPGTPILDKRDELDAKFTQFSSAVIGQLEARLEYWGYSRDVPA